MLRPAKLLRNFLPTLFLSLSAGLFAGPTVALAACEGSSESVCTSESSCSWVGSYTDSDGAVMNSVCRDSSSATTRSSFFGWWKPNKDRHDRHDRHDEHGKYDQRRTPDKHKPNAENSKHKKAQALHGKTKHASNMKKTSVMNDGKKASVHGSKGSNSPKAFKAAKSNKLKSKKSAKRMSRKNKSKKSRSKRRQ